MVYTQPPLGRYQDKLVGFIHEMTPIVLTQPEQELMLEFQEGRRKGLGMRAASIASLMHCVALQGAVLTWKTLCFPHQLSVIYGPSLKRGATWINAYAYFIANCDPILKGMMQFDVVRPYVTIIGDEYQRIVAFEPCESSMEFVRPHMTNVVYYDFDDVPTWLISDCEHTLKFRNKPITFSITLDRAMRARISSEPNDRLWTPDGSADAD